MLKIQQQSQKDIEGWESEGVIKYLGVSNDVRLEISDADCIVLPSYYREGTPKTLLEAAAIGRPIITTDSVGCRDVVVDSKNGFLCQPRDAQDLAKKMMKMVELGYDERIKMSEYGRRKMEQEYSEEIVIEKYLSLVKKIVG